MSSDNGNFADVPIGAARAQRAARDAALAVDPLAGPPQVPVSGAGERRPVRDRVPFGTMEQKLAAPPRPGYHRHWFNDEPGRVARAEAAGYAKVNSPTGQPMTNVVGTAKGGGALIGYLMEIPLEWYEEDRRAEEAEYRARVEGIQAGRIPGGPLGSDGAAQYVGKQGIHIGHGPTQRR